MVCDLELINDFCFNDFHRRGVFCVKCWLEDINRGEKKKQQGFDDDDENEEKENDPKLQSCLRRKRVHYPTNDLNSVLNKVSSSLVTSSF